MRQYLEGSSCSCSQIVQCARHRLFWPCPITPQTHIVESLAQMVADGELNAEFINVELRALSGLCSPRASATGVRTYTATHVARAALHDRGAL